MIPYIGDFAEDATVYHYFNTFDSNDPSSSVTVTDLVDADIFVYKDGSVTDIVTDGATVVIDFDSRTGIHKVTIDTSVHADYAVGSDYLVTVIGVTVDGGTINAGVFTFSIENRFNDVNVVQISGAATAADNLELDYDGTGYNKANSTIGVATDVTTVIEVDAIALNGNLTAVDNLELVATTGYDATSSSLHADVVNWNGSAVATPSITGVPEVDITFWAGSASTSAQLVDDIWDEAIEDHDTQGNAGWAQMLLTYGGPRGPGAYLDDAAANTNTVNGTDGTAINPVSTIATAKTIADAIGTRRIYLVNDSAITLGVTMADYEFVGIGPASGNTIALASQDTAGSSFHNVTISGVQGGTTRAMYEDCILDTSTLYMFARRCGLVTTTGITLSNNDDNVMDHCFSMVPGNATPVLIASGANLDLSIRHYSGGIQLNTLSATGTVSIEADGQVIFNADCNTAAAVTMRGNMTVTDNTGGMSALTDTAVVNQATVNAEVDTALADIGLDHLISSALPTNWATDVASGSVFDNIADDGTAVFDRTTDSLQAIADSGGGGPTAAQIADQVWDEAQADHVGAGSFGIIATEIADILTDTADIQPNYATSASITALNDIAAGDVWAVDATTQQTQGTFGQAIGDPVADTTTIYQSVATDATGDNVAVDVVAVKAETALILADTADIQPNYATSTALSTVDTEVGQIKTVTDQMVFTKANELDVNTQSINGAAVVGDGNATPWDGA